MSLPKKVWQKSRFEKGLGNLNAEGMFWWSQNLDLVAEAKLQPLEAALQLPAAQQLLLEQNLGLVETLPIRQTDENVDEVRQSRAAMDIKLATTIQVTDADDGQSYIETADVTTTLQGGPLGDIVIEQSVGDVMDD